MSTVPAKETIVGQQFDAVKAQLEAAGFVVYQQVQASSEPLSEILDMSGADAGANVQKGTIITLVTSDNSLFRVPNVTNQSEEIRQRGVDRGRLGRRKCGSGESGRDGQSGPVGRGHHAGPGRRQRLQQERRHQGEDRSAEPGHHAGPHAARPQRTAQAAAQAAGFAGSFVANDVDGHRSRPGRQGAVADARRPAPWWRRTPVSHGGVGRRARPPPPRRPADRRARRLPPTAGDRAHRLPR